MNLELAKDANGTVELRIGWFQYLLDAQQLADLRDAFNAALTAESGVARVVTNPETGYHSIEQDWTHRK